jgi:hypothetical protein
MDEVPGGRFVGPTHQGHRPQDDPLVPTQVRRRCLDFPRGGTDSAVELPPPRPPTGAAAAQTAFGCEPHRAFIEEQLRLRLRRNATTIYQVLVDQHGFTGA